MKMPSVPPASVVLKDKSYHRENNPRSFENIMMKINKNPLCYINVTVVSQEVTIF